MVVEAAKLDPQQQQKFVQLSEKLLPLFSHIIDEKGGLISLGEFCNDSRVRESMADIPDDLPKKPQEVLKNFPSYFTFFEKGRVVNAQGYENGLVNADGELDEEAVQNFRIERKKAKNLEKNKNKEGKGPTPKGPPGPGPNPTKKVKIATQKVKKQQLVLPPAPRGPPSPGSLTKLEYKDLRDRLVGLSDHDFTRVFTAVTTLRLQGFKPADKSEKGPVPQKGLKKKGVIPTP